MLKSEIIVYPTTTYIVIMVHTPDEDLHFSSFFSELNKTIQELVRQYDADVILVNNLSKISDKVFRKLSEDKNISCQVKMLGGK